ncbi:hypothetical protein IWQ60_007671 [Tieghemiomyces parasiticus]|uniref:Peptidase S8/S53 domain-containing protein n=1 Tax=Tieghemiomyces parasiticus TaxID=78921 RepID=A0A9W8A1U8_9FUNG|nr:hypothetical protein IWQ60_007671 [Tieghemiomyces parasiticus]
MLSTGRVYRAGLLALAISALSAQAQVPRLPTDNSLLVPNEYLITFTGEPGTSEGIAAANDFFASLKTKKIPYTIYENYTTLLNGAYIGVEDKYYDAVHSISTAASISASRLSITDDSPPINDKSTANPPLPMLADEYTGVNLVRNSTKWDGTNVKVGIIDSGIDYNHPAFGSCYKTKDCRIQYGYNYVSDTGRTDPLDTCNGHGTHVAGILAGNHGVFKGVAPNATLGIYRAVGCDNKGSVQHLAKAAEQAYKDGMQVVNISFGSPGGWSDWVMSTLVDKLRAHQIHVVTGAGNNGMDGLWTVVSPAVSRYSIAVGSMEVPKIYSLYMNVTVGGKTIPVRRSEQQTTIPLINLKDAPFTRGLSSAGDDYGCSPIANDVKGAVVLIQRQYCSLTTKAANVYNAGGAALAVYNTDSSDMGVIIFEYEVNLPSFTIFQNDGQALVALLDANKDATVTVDHSVFVFDNQFATAPAFYSSWGPNPEGPIKPDLLAPGSYIYSSLPLNQGSYGLMSGTSMAAPYVAGLVALLIQSGATFDDNNLMSNVIHTATPAKNAAGQFYSVAQQGTGLVNAYNALTANLAFRTRYNLPTYYDDFSYSTYPFAIYYENHGTGVANYKFAAKTCLSVSGVGTDTIMATPPLTSTAGASVSFSTTSLSTKAGSNGNFQVTITNSKLDRKAFLIYSGYIQAYAASGSTGYTYSFPYMGYAYDSSSISVLDKSLYGLPCMVRQSEYQCLDPSASHKFTFTGRDFPVILLRFQAPVAQMMIKVAYAATPTKNHASVEDYFFSLQSRTMDSTGYQYVEKVWDGMSHATSTPQNVYMMPKGKYVLRFQIQPVRTNNKIQYYTSPTIEIGS